MTVTVILNNGQIIQPTYDPSHTEEIAEFYNREQSRGAIWHWFIQS